MTKNELRKSFLAKRELMSRDEIVSKSQSICDTILQSTEYKKAKQLFCYYPLASEVDIKALAKKGLADGKTIGFPKVINKTTIKFYKIESFEEFEKGNFNVMEPTTGKELSIQSETLMIVPGLVFDDENYRIGYGGGYYDRYIQKALEFNSFLTTIGVCYSWQRAEKLPRNSYDQKVDRILNER